MFDRSAGIVKALCLSTGLAVFPAWAMDYSAEGFGNVREEARQQAQAALAESLWVEVSSELRAESSSDSGARAEQRIHSRSELPLMAVVSDCSRSGKEFRCQANMNSEQAAKLYLAEVKSLEFRLNNLLEKITPASYEEERERYRLLNDFLSQHERYNQYRRMLRLLGSTRYEGAEFDIETVRGALLEIEGQASDLQIAARAVARNIPDRRYYIYPPAPRGSKMVTELGHVLKQHLSSVMCTIETPDNADIILRGEYQVNDDSIDWFSRGYDENGDILFTRVQRLAPAAYGGLDYQPVDTAFEQLLDNGYVLSNEFRAELSTSLWRENLLFSAGQIVRLMVKLNQPGYFYIVAHNPVMKLSYLLELSSAKGRRAFVRYMSADDANHWLSLGEFEVTRPFGAEHLQLIASSRDLIDHLPVVRYDADSGLYVVDSEGIKRAVQRTRALKPKTSASTRSAEATLSYGTIDSR